MKPKRNRSKDDDARSDAEGASRVNKTHGGELVEAIAPEDLESFNDASCKHEKMVRDPSEKDFIAFMCANPDCNVVVLYNRDN